MSLRTPMTLLVLLGVVVGAGWYGWTQFQRPFENPFGSSSDSCVTETLEAGGKLYRRHVVVNVYNAGTRSDLASSTLEDLVGTGFLRGVSTNAPPKLEVAAVLVVDSNPSSALVRLVREQFQGEVVAQRRPDLREEGVDVFVGNGYRGLSEQAPRAVTLLGDLDVCIPPTAG